MVLGLITVILVDAILFLMINLVHTQSAQKKQGIPIMYAVGLFCLSCVAHFAATKTLGRAVTTTTEARLSVVATVVFGFAPIWAYVHMLCGRIGEEAGRRRAQLYPRARKLRADGNLEGALREYLRYYEANPKSARPLFSAAGMLEGMQDYEKAATLFRQIMERFQDDQDVWTKAGYRLAFVREHHLDDAEGAQTLRAAIKQRIPADIRAKHEERDLKSSRF